MAAFTGTEQAHCVFWFQEAKSTTQVQKILCTHYGKDLRLA
jgi:hypothetical protein